MLNAVLTERIEITPELLILRIKPDAGIPDFISGQYLALGLMPESPRPAHFPPEKETPPAGKLLKRAYSIGSSPLQKEYLEFYIAVVPDGSFTSRMVSLKVGDRLYAAPKITGTFTLLNVKPDANLVLVSTGTGIAPFVSMLRTPNTWEKDRQITMIHGVRYATDLAYASELKQFVTERKNFRYLPVVSREKSGQKWDGAKGHVHIFFESGEISLKAQTDNVFLCGNPAMVDSMKARLEKIGYIEHTKKHPGNLHIERYW